MILPLLLVLAALGGPAQAISGKYAQHSDEYKAKYGVPPPFVPSEDPSIEELCALIEGGHGYPGMMAKLAEKLLEDGQGELAFRAFGRARELGFKHTAWIESKKDECPRVPLEVVRAERKDADKWVKQLQNFERKQLAAGEDPDDLTEFYLLYGRAEQSMSAVMRNRRVSFLGGVAGILIGIGFAAVSRALPRKLVLAPLLVGIALVFAPMVVGQPGLLRWGAGAALAGAALVWMFGRRA